MNWYREWDGRKKEGTASSVIEGESFPTRIFTCGEDVFHSFK